MSGKLSPSGYADTLAGDIEWLRRYPCTLERGHIEEVLRASLQHEYPGAVTEIPEQASEGIRPPHAISGNALDAALECVQQSLWDGQDNRGAAAVISARARINTLRARLDDMERLWDKDRNEVARLQLQGHSMFGKGQDALAEELRNLRARVKEPGVCSC